jgi:Flp pilus assembly protein TadB
VVPLIGNVLGAGTGLVAMLATIVVAPAVVAFAWLWYRPLVSVAVVAVAAGLIFLLKRLAESRSAARTAPPAFSGR